MVLDLKGEQEFDISVTNMVYDIGAITILVIVFDPTVIKSYNYYYNKRHHIETEKPDSQKTFVQTLILIIITTVYFSIGTEKN